MIPVTMRAKMKDKVHAAHTGIQGCLRRAREAIYWPGMNEDLTDLVSKCDICTSHSKVENAVQVELEDGGRSGAIEYICTVQ